MFQSTDVLGAPTFSSLQEIILSLYFRSVGSVCFLHSPSYVVYSRVRIGRIDVVTGAILVPRTFVANAATALDEALSVDSDETGNPTLTRACFKSVDACLIANFRPFK